MEERGGAAGDRRNIWVRGLYMLLMGLAFHVCGTVLCIVTLVQFVIALAGGTPNARLLRFGRTLGAYLQQIVCYLTFATETLPFPFSEWPDAD